MPDGQDAAALEAIDHDSIGDRHVRELIERYVLVAGATLTELGPQLFELVPPAQDRAAFNGRTRIRLAFSVEAVQADPVAEMAILGGGFVEQLITAIRSRGTRRHAGSVGTADWSAVEQPGLPVLVRRGSVGAPTSQFTRHRLGRLTARVVIRAGTALEEHLVESDVFDLTTGLLMSADVAAECARPAVAAPGACDGVEAPPRPLQELLPMLLSNLEGSLRPQIDTLAQNAHRDLAHELGRIERYYASLLEDIGGRGTDVPDANSRRVIEAERNRRIAEETDRHQVRAMVHPVQLTEWDALVQRVEWQLASQTGNRAALSAQRVLAGDRSWLIGCPTCGKHSPLSVAVCIHEHVTCDTCSHECSVCSDSFCTSHGTAACHVDLAPACSTHARTCRSCLRPHCSEHEGVCVDGGHPTCTSCLAACATCGRLICNRHAELSHDSAPRGPRRFCHDCACKCEGGSNEIVGKDEVAQCASCERTVCERHQARCAVDGHIHCSTHLRRTDRSRRLVCEKDRAGCAFEPTAVFALDEVSACSECGLQGCAQHVVPCDADGRRFCHTHLLGPRDKHGARVCRQHHTVCHVDGAPFTISGTKDCPVCGKHACPEHSRDCRTCGRSTCTSDSAADGRCSTCTRLSPTSEPSDDVIAAANRLFEDAGRAKSWRTARDASHTIVEADLGWTRRVTFVLRHGEQRAERAISTSVLGTKKLPI